MMATTPDNAWQEADQQIRLGELRNAAAILGAQCAAEASSATMSLYSHHLAMTVPARRALVAVCLEETARRLLETAKKLSPDKPKT